MFSTTYQLGNIIGVNKTIRINLKHFKNNTLKCYLIYTFSFVFEENVFKWPINMIKIKGTV